MFLNDRLSSHRSARLSSRVLYAAVLVFVCCTILFLGAPLALAQSAGSGAITGTVTDPSGASVPNVTVTATSAATNQSRSMTTGSDGVYKFSLLTPGTYTLKFSAANFKTAQVTGVTVAVTETQTIDQVLEVGAVTEKVTVEANVETIQTESSTLGTTVSGNSITALPLANRNYTQIISLSAGTNAGVNNATSMGKGTNDMAVNGSSAGQNNFQMDGVAVNNIANSGTANDGTIYTGIPIPSPDAIQEFKVQTSTYDASYGRNPGANVNVVTKSGTNNFHGTAFEYLRNSVLNADDFFYPKHNPGTPAHQVLDQNQFGGVLGGPIKKDKLFFFFSYQGTRGKNGVAPQGKTFGAQLPAIPVGDRSTPAVQDAIANVLCQPEYQIIIPITGPSAGCDHSGDPTPGPNYQGPANFSAVGLNILNLKNADGSYYLPSPAENSACAPNGDPAIDFYTCNFTVPAIYSENQFVANGDYIINSKHTLEMRYFYTHNPQLDTLGQAGGLLPGTPENVPWGNQNAALKFRSIVTNNFVNEARISFQRNLASGTQTMPFLNGKRILAADIGQTPLNTGNMPQVSIIATGGYTMFGTLFPFNGPTNQIQAADQISWSHGKHSIRAGFEYEDTRWPLVDRGLELGLGIFLSLNDMLAQSPFGGGNEFLCLFCVKGIDTEQGITHFYKLPNMNGFVLDDWKVSPRLTMNIGLRWEFDGQLSDSFGRLTQVWTDRMVPYAPVPTSFAAALADPSGVGVQQYVVPSNFAAHFGQPPTGVFTANNKHSISGHAPYSNFAPRIGFAWQPLSGGKLVLRGGFGLFYDRVGLDLLVHAFEQGYPYAATYDFGPFTPRWAAASTANPYPAIQLVPLPSNPTLGFAPRFSDWTTGESSGLSTPYVPSSIHTPLTREYNLNLQYEFAPAWVLELGYVGTSGINLIDYNHNHNQATLATPTNNLSYLCDSETNICNTSGNAAFRVPYLGYATSGLQASDFNGRSNYNSLQATVRHQFSHGLSMQAAYTWSKNLSTVFSSNAANMNNALDMNQQYGRVYFDRPQRLSVNYSYDLPFGKNATGVAGKLASGWNVSGVTVVQSGNPLTFIDPGIAGLGIPGSGSAYGTSSNSIYTGVGRAQFCSGMGNGNIKSPGDITANLNSYFSPTAFSTFDCKPGIVPYGDATALDFGNSGVGAVLGPGQFNFDMSILKNTKLMEGLSMQFRADFYNAFNHPQFSPPTGGFGSLGFEDITSASYGRITNTTVNPRLIQFGVKFIF